MAFSSGTSALSSEINVTPLIDVLLALLIIFMVIGPVPALGLESQIPQGTPEAVKTLPPVILHVLAGGVAGSARYEVGTEPIPREALPSRLRAMFAARQDRTLFLQADRALSYLDVANAVSEARAAGAGAVVLSAPHS